MRRGRILLRLIGYVCFCGASTFCLLAQDWQNRDAVHFQADFAKHWFAAVWSVTNLRTQTLNNTNLFTGVGYRGKNWWLEGMLQRQWNSKANQRMLDFRFDWQGKRWHLFAEAAPFLTKPAFYEYAMAEVTLWRGWRAGVETENTHQAGKDTVAAGLRAGRKLGRFVGFDVSSAAAVRWNLNGGRTEPRLYLVFNRRFALRDRK